MATLAQIRTACDNKLDGLWATVQSREAAYAAAHNGRFWQGLITHNVIPSEGVEAAPTVGQACPSDQPGSPWPAGILSSTLPMALQIDVYDGPLGPGYCARLTVSVLGQVYQRTAQVGPETWLAQAWAVRPVGPV